MDTIQINKFLKNHKNTKKIFLDCTSSDKIPLSDIYPYSCVVNTDDSSKPGQHWVSVYVPDSKTIEYFDSYALEPNENIKIYLEKFEKVIKNDTCLQNLYSDVCGEYCIYFLINRGGGKNFHEIIENLSRKNERDKFVKTFVWKYNA